MSAQSLISEVLEFLKIRKRYWLMPIVLLLFFLGIVLVFAETSVIAPLIYTLF